MTGCKLGRVFEEFGKADDREEQRGKEQRGDPSVCSEKRKIKCGKAHFDELDGVEYGQIAKVSDLD